MTEFESSLQQLRRLRAPDCPPLRVLGEFLDGKASPEQMQAVQAHLQGCPACTNSLIDLRELARLEKHGENPPADLLSELKDLVRVDDLAREPRSSVWNRLYRAWSATLAVLRERAVVRIGVELAGAAAVAGLALYMTGVIPSEQAREGAPKPIERLATVKDLSGADARVVESVSLALADYPWVQKRVLPTLEKLPKTLVLEETRGATNVEVYKKAAPATVLVLADDRLGSGVVVSARGDVITNWHVVHDAKQMAVVFKPERGVDIRKEPALTVTVIKADEVADLALLKISRPPSGDLRYLRLGDTTRIEVGEDAHSIGHPDGEVWTYTAGIVSQVRPDYEWESDGRVHHAGVIQTQTALNPGNSGGPLLNDAAEIIGINSFRREGEGLNYAVAADVVRNFLGSQASPRAEKARGARRATNRTERYADRFIGAYVSTSAPPPDLWFVYPSRGAATALYVAGGATDKTRIDTVIVRDESKPSQLVYYFDSDCDGKVDVVAHGSTESEEIEGYELPSENLRVSSLARDLADALARGAIPYRQVRVCQ